MIVRIQLLEKNQVLLVVMRGRLESVRLSGRTTSIEFSRT